MRILDPNPMLVTQRAERDAWLRTGALAATLDRTLIGSDVAILSTGRLSMSGIYLRAGMLVSTITLKSGGTPAATPTHQWFSLWRASDLLKLGVTADDTTTAWGANAEKALAMASPYTVPTSGRYYIGCVVTAGTVPTLRGLGSSSATSGFAPIKAGTADINLTDPASAPTNAAVLTGVGNDFLAWVS